MATVIICIILLVICIFGVKSYAGKLSHGCCGGASDAVKRKKPQDEDISHYPYSYVIEIDGMTCKNCAARIENAFNTDDSGNYYAKVNLGTKKAFVHTKHVTPETELGRIVARTGYTAVNVVKE